MLSRTFVPAFALILAVGTFSDAAPPKKASLATRWAAKVTVDDCWRQYPRPQLTRTDWMNLNGTWDLAILPASVPTPTEFDKKILVPFPVESFLGGVRARVEPEQRVWYRRAFTLPEKWNGRRVLLHFGAVDWEASVWVNDVKVGDHQGGYDPFTFDISDALEWSGANEVIVAVSDPTDHGTQPHGKQQLVPEGIRYMPTTGIWQTVWIEPVPESSIDGLKITPNVPAKSVTIEVAGRGVDKTHGVEVDVMHDGSIVASGEAAHGAPLTLGIPDAQLWSPDHPFLYDLNVRLTNGAKTVDEVGAYFGLRSIALGQDKNGLTRIMLNGESLFQLGVLDQGYWPDGLYTPPSDEAIKHDLEVAKQFGFNMIRKHVKVEPARWYYWCDRLGLLVWQDMPSGDEKGPWPQDGIEITRSAESADQFRKELKAMVDFGHNFPCIVVWIPFNEAWGQFDSKQISEWLKQYDPTRLVIAASGGNDFGVGDVDDDHFYPGPGGPPAERGRAAVLGEFGGLGLPLTGHTWQDEANWGYRSFNKKDDLALAYVDLIKKLRPLVRSHLSAAVFTQLTDVEIEVNGLMTYDREVIKIPVEEAAAANSALFEPLPPLTVEQRRAAPTLAWWRFEDGEPGEMTPNIADNKGAIGVRDLSGHNNHLFAFSGRTAPRFAKMKYAAELGPLNGENQGCLDDTRPPASGVLVRDLFTDPNLARTHMNVLNTYPFTEWTVEASFALAAGGGPQVILSKQGRQAQTPYPPFQLGVFGEGGVIQLQFIDASGRRRVIDSKTFARVGTWYHIAATSDGKTLKFYIREDGQPDYELRSESQVEGGLTLGDGTWAVGRGYYEDQIAFDACAFIDEVRISVVARPKEEFLFAP
ncbi:MAG: hypothetical protein H0T51_17560 [Pirellulales bacterium]|nr:hypothetical protein [Pirellulales bacterium]